jgi:hypothetical protein
LTSPEQQLAYGTATLGRLTEADKRVAKLLEQAAKKADSEPEALRCVEGAKSTLDTMRKVAERSVEQLRGALAEGNAYKAQQSVRQITIIDIRINEVVATAEGCLGEQGVANKSTSAVDSNASALADNSDIQPLFDPSTAVDVESLDATPFE